jgi:hypothetical protein
MHLRPSTVERLALDRGYRIVGAGRVTYNELSRAITGAEDNCLHVKAEPFLKLFQEVDNFIIGKTCFVSIRRDPLIIFFHSESCPL